MKFQTRGVTNVELHISGLYFSVSNSGRCFIAKFPLKNEIFDESCSSTVSYIVKHKLDSVEKHNFLNINKETDSIVFRHDI